MILHVLLFLLWHSGSRFWIDKQAADNVITAILSDRQTRVEVLLRILSRQADRSVRLIEPDETSPQLRAAVTRRALRARVRARTT